MDTYHITDKDITQLWRQLRESARKRNIPFDLTPSDINDIGIPLTCPVLNIPIYFNRGSPKDNSISFDRIDSTKGYTRDNLVIVSYRANKLKSNATLEEMENLVTFYKELT
tara:strand:+ start:48 stop:380 length:333 start_codon:yes stop_codon:yes gene_type:complete